jgi:hypothetical protein
MESFAETLLEPRNAGAAHAEEGRCLLQGGMRHSRQKDSLSGAQFSHVSRLGDNSLRLEDEFRINPAGS